MMKKYVRLFAVLCFCICLFGVLSASAATQSGSCGNGVTWSFDADSGELVISGSGAMNDYLGNAPWRSMRDGIKTVVLTEGVTRIGDHAFADSDALTAVTIPESVTSIGDHAFFGCGALTSVVLPEGVERIGSFAFSECFALTSVALPNTVARIGNYAFCRTGLTSVTIPNSISQIESCAFAYCNALTAFSVENGNAVYSSDACGALLDKAQTTLICYPANGACTEYVLPDSVTRIEDRAFEDCARLTAVEIPDGVDYIGERAFAFCFALESVEISDNVNYIGNMAFGCCNAMTAFSVGEGNPYYCSDAYGALYDKNMETLLWYPVGNPRTEYAIPDGVTRIGEAAFANCRTLLTVTIPDSVSQIDDRAFIYCYALTSLAIPRSVKRIGSDVAEECDRLTIYGEVGSAAEAYARENDVSFDKISNFEKPAPTPESKPKPTMPGDVNGDGRVSVLDALVALNAAQSGAADSAKDALQILEMILDA